MIWLPWADICRVLFQTGGFWLPRVSRQKGMLQQGMEKVCAGTGEGSEAKPLPWFPMGLTGIPEGLWILEFAEAEQCLMIIGKVQEKTSKVLACWFWSPVLRGCNTNFLCLSVSCVSCSCSSSWEAGPETRPSDGFKPSCFQIH